MSVNAHSLCLSLEARNAELDTDVAPASSKVVIFTSTKCVSRLGKVQSVQLKGHAR